MRNPGFGRARLRRGTVLIAGIALVATLLPIAASSAAVEGPEEATYLLHHLASDQYLATDGWGPSVLASHFDGAMAQWALIEQPEGTVAIRNSVTGQHLDDAAGTSGHDVGTSHERSASTSWELVDTAGGVQIVAGGDYLVADGFTVRTTNQVSAQTTWELVEVEPEAARYVTLTNVGSDQVLAITGPGEDGLVVTADFVGPSPATAHWRLVEQVSTSRKCERHASWNVPNEPGAAYGDTSRVTTCHVLVSRAASRALDADSADSDYAVTTTDAVAQDAYWALSDIAAGPPITLLNAAFDRYLADVDGDARTVRDAAGATAQWVLTDVDTSCDQVDAVRIDSHDPGQTVDTTPTGTTTGSYVLYGVAPADATSVTVEADGQVGIADMQRDECENGWSIEVGAVETAAQTFTVTATGASGATVATIDLAVIAPTADDVLLQPAFVGTPQFHDLLVAYDDTTGALAFAGDVANELQPGDGLGGGESAAAPDGYLRIVTGVEYDGVNTIVSTRQAGLTEFVRQVHIDIEGANQSTVEPAASLSATEPRVEFSDVEPDLRGTTAMLDDGEGATALAGPEAAAVPIGDGLELALDFSIDPEASFELDIDLDWPCFFCLPSITVATFWFEVGFDIGAEATLDYTIDQLVNKTGRFGPELDDFVFARITVPTPVGIPIVVVFEADSQPFYDLSISAAARLEIKYQINLAAGFEHKADGSGRGAYREGNVDGGSLQPELAAGILVTASLGVEIDIEAQLYGQAGVELEASPQLEFEAMGDVVAREVPWSLALVVPFEAGVDVEIELGPLEWEAEFGSISILELSFVLAQGVWFEEEGDDLTAALNGPPGVFPGQEFAFTIGLTNEGTVTLEGVTVDMVLPDAGSFVSSSPAGTPSSPAPGATYRIDAGIIPAGETETVTVRWRAPDQEGTALSASATVSADNAASVGPLSSTVFVGVEGRCNPCGAATAGVGLRNRSQGTIEINGLPAGAVVTRAVLTWGVLYSGSTPRDTITVNGTQVSANVGADVSGTLCWGDSSTIGYAADVTALVDGNGTYVISDPARGTTRVDSSPDGVLPYTDGASLVVFYVGGGANSQVISDFTYSTNTATGILRTFSGVNSLGFGGRVTLAGPDGQNNGSETFNITGSGTITLTNTWDGSAPQEGPSFSIGNLWDNDTHDVSSVLPPGQSSLQVRHVGGTDCVGVSAAVLEVPQG